MFFSEQNNIDTDIKQTSIHATRVCFSEASTHQNYNMSAHVQTRYKQATKHALSELQMFLYKTESVQMTKSYNVVRGIYLFKHRRPLMYFEGR